MGTIPPEPPAEQEPKHYRLVVVPIAGPGEPGVAMVAPDGPWTAVAMAGSALPGVYDAATATGLVAAHYPAQWLPVTWPDAPSLAVAPGCPRGCSLRHLTEATVIDLYAKYVNDPDRPYAPRRPTLADFRANKMPGTSDKTLGRHLREHLGLHWPPI